jgi:hypothetical protein
MRISRFHIILFSALASMVCEIAHGAEIYIVTRSDVKLTSSEIREIYLGDKEFSGALRIIPIDNQAVQSDFTAKVLAMGVDRYNVLWTKKSFRDALTPPMLKTSDIEVLDFIRRTRGAIGYVSSAPQDKTVIVVGKF